MSIDKPITHGLTQIGHTAVNLGQRGTRMVQNAVMGARQSAGEFREKNTFYNDPASRQAMIEGIKSIQQFPRHATNLLAQDNVRHAVRHVGQYVPQPVLLGLGGLAGTGLVLQTTQKIRDKLKPKRCRSPLVYAAPALLAGMLISEHMSPILKKIQEGTEQTAPKKPSDIIQMTHSPVADIAPQTPVTPQSDEAQTQPQAQQPAANS